jgi:dihydroxy-acid dehydratase
MKAIGFTDETLAKPQIGVAHCWIGRCRTIGTIASLAAFVAEGVREEGGTPIEVNTDAINVGITTGTEGMNTSLVSRDLIADSVELVARGHMFDGLVTIAGCDKTIPAMTIQDIYEAVGAFNAGRISADELKDFEDHACPGAASCGGQVTANTMATACEMLGLIRRLKPGNFRKFDVLSQITSSWLNPMGAVSASVRLTSRQGRAQ